MHNTITAPELQNLLKYSSNFPAYLIFHCPTMQFQLKVYISFWFWNKFSAKLIRWNWEAFHIILQILFVNTIFSFQNLWSLIWPTIETLFFHYIYQFKFRVPSFWSTKSLWEMRFLAAKYYFWTPHYYRNNVSLVL